MNDSNADQTNALVLLMKGDNGKRKTTKLEMMRALARLQYQKREKEVEEYEAKRQRLGDILKAKAWEIAKQIEIDLDEDVTIWDFCTDGKLKLMVKIPNDRIKKEFKEYMNICGERVFPRSEEYFFKDIKAKMAAADTSIDALLANKDVRAALEKVRKHLFDDVIDAQ